MATPEALVVAERVPQVAPAQPAPERLHFTPKFCASLVTVAVTGSCCATCSEAVGGFTVSETIGAGVIVICAVAIFFGLASAMARMVTTEGVGTENGAV